MWQRLKEAERIFAPGTPVAIIEPYYMLMLDGTYSVSVDDPRDVCVRGRGPEGGGQCQHACHLPMHALVPWTT